MKPDITLCGCGWLGQQVAQLAHPTYHVLGTSRLTEKSAEKAATLAAAGITPMRFSLGQSATALAAAAAGSTVILNIPPGARKGPLDPAYLPQMLALIETFAAHPTTQLLFLSTTSVYGNQPGVVTEKTPTAPVTASGKAHVAIEQHLLRCYPERACVVRLAGLVGPGRHPARYLAGRSLEEGEQVVNLVHSADICQALLTLIRQPRPGQTLHLCSLRHPKRGYYYPYCAEQMGLEAPHFAPGFEQQAPAGKQIDARASWTMLGIEPRYADPYDMCTVEN